MKSQVCVRIRTVLALTLIVSGQSLRAAGPDGLSPFIYESDSEFFGSGDFDGDGRTDVVIMDKESGRFRIGYQLTNGVVSWGDCRPTGEKGITGFTIGKLVDSKHDSIAVTAPDANRLVIVDASNPTETARPQPIAFDAGLGPNTIVAIDIGGPGNNEKADLYVASMYNTPDPF